MIALPARILLFAIALGLLPVEGASAADRYKAFRGNFTGSANIKIAAGQVFRGTGRISVSGPTDGSSLRVVLKGTVAKDGLTTDYANVFVFNGTGAFQVRDGIFDLTKGSAFPFSGQAKLGRFAIKGTGAALVGTETNVFTYSFKTKKVGNTQIFVVDYVVTRPSGTFPMKFIASRQLQ